MLVTGPTGAGVTSVVRQLRERIAGHTFLEAGEIGAAEVPTAVVFVVSAIAPVTESDCAVAVLAAAQTDAVVAVVAKIDDHRDWRGVLAADRERLAEHSQRFRRVPWVGAAAAPRLGEPHLDELVELIQRQLADPRLPRRNRLRAWESELCAEIARLDADAAGADLRVRVETLRGRRAALLRHRERSRSDGSIALRSLMQQARVALMYSARNRCAGTRIELLERVAVTTRRDYGDVEQRVRRQCQAVERETDDEIVTRTREVAAELGLAVPPRPAATPGVTVAAPPLKSRQLETQLMTVLGAGFGLGVALVISRLFVGVAPELTVAGSVAGGLVGVALTVWVVRVRGLLHDRAVLDRWVHEVSAGVRSAVEEKVAAGLLAAEASLASALLARSEDQRAEAGRRLAEIDAELGEHARTVARAEAARERSRPGLERALDACRVALAAVNSTESVVTGR